jgi:outer membrane biosynthesis protein TonB
MDKDASQMTDEELDHMIESGSPLEESPSEAPQEGEPTTPNEEVVEEVVEEVEVPKEAGVEVEEPQATVEEPPASPRENLRIQKLLERMKQQSQPQEPVKATGIDYGTALDADPEVISQLEADRQAASQAAYSQGLEQAKSIQFQSERATPSYVKLDARIHPPIFSALPERKRILSQSNHFPSAL